MSKNIYTQLLCCLQDGQNATLITQITGKLGKKSQGIKKQLITGSPCEEIARQALEQGLPVTETQQDTTVLAEPFYPEERLIVLGGGHIALPLAEFAVKIGFSVHVVDDRPSFANASRFPMAKRVICEAFDKAIEQLNITQCDYVVIITRGHRHDQTCLEQLLKGTEPFYTGMIGSRRRVAAVKEALAQQGCNSQRLECVHTPIGLAIGAITPEEIAISIVAELISCKRQKNEVRPGIVRYDNRSDVDFDVLRALSEETDKPKSIVTVISSKGSVPRGAGAKMLVYADGKIVGSIGGGCSEAAVIDDARQILGTSGYKLQTVDLTGDSAEDEGMVCGGVMDVLIEDYQQSV
jgi:xanthine dehydrogenase accessory factor